MGQRTNAAAAAPDLQVVQSGGRRPGIWDAPYALVTRRQKNTAIAGALLVAVQMTLVAIVDWSDPAFAFSGVMFCFTTLCTVILFELHAWAFRPMPEAEVRERERRAADLVALYLDDIGIELPDDAEISWQVDFFAPTWRIETTCMCRKPTVSGPMASTAVLSHLFREEFLRGCWHGRGSATAVRLGGREFRVSISKPSSHQRLAAYGRMQGRIS